MARSIAIIQAGILAVKNAQSALSGLNSPSQVAIYRTWIFIQAVTMNLFEQAQDIYKADLEDKIKNAAITSRFWLQSQIFKFQYSATTPQILEVNTTNFSINYPTIDSSLCIVTRCAVVRTSQRVVLIKVAKSEPPVPLSAPELSSLGSYVDDIVNSGTNYTCQSLAADKIVIEAEIKFNGQYAATISPSVISAINSFLAGLDFNGSVNLLALEIYIKTNVVGVTDIKLINVAIRADAAAFASRTFLVQNSTTIITNYPTYAGYVVEETESGYDFASTLIFTAQ